MTAAVMSEFPFFYNRVSPTTWIHLSSLLTIAVFFKFSRLWSIRNLDLICLIAIAPGLLAVQYGHGIHDVSIEQAGYIWVFAGTLVFFIRMLIDPMMVRRPLLEPNLSAGGLTFLGIALFVFLMANVLTGNPARSRLAVAVRSPPRREPNVAADERAAREGPGYPPAVSYAQHHHSRHDRSQRGGQEAAENQPPRRPCAGRSAHVAGRADAAAFGGRSRLGDDRVSAFRQHQDGDRRGALVFAASLYGRNDGLSAARLGGRAVGLCDPCLSPAADRGRVHRIGDRT